MSLSLRCVRHQWLLWVTPLTLSFCFLFVFLYAEAGVTQRTGEGGCSRDDVAVYQGATAPLPNGIPTYTVEILNVCAGGCAVGDIHVSCGWFSSARLINPRVFRRVRFDDCLVNDGAALAPGQSLSFQYANTYPYRLYVSSLSCY